MNVFLVFVYRVFAHGPFPDPHPPHHPVPPPKVYESPIPFGGPPIKNVKKSQSKGSPLSDRRIGRAGDLTPSYQTPPLHINFCDLGTAE